MSLPPTGLAELLAAIPDAALVVAADGTIVHANSLAEGLFGYPAGGLAGRPHDLLVPEAGRGPHRLGFAAFFAQPSRHAMAAGHEIAGLRADGSEFPAECFLSPLETEGGRCALAVVRDLTERRRTEKKLREREQRLDFLVSNSPAVVYACEPSGAFGATFVSPDVVHQLGYEAREFLEDSGFWAAHVHPDDAPRVFSGLKALFAEGTHAHEYRLRHRDGSWRWMHDELKLIRGDDGEPLEIVGFWVDVTQRKRAEEDLRRRTRSLATLLEVSQSIAATLDMDRVLQATTDGVTRLVGLDTAAVYLLEGKSVRLHATTPPLPPEFPEDLRGAVLADHPHMHRAVSFGEPVFLADAARASLTPAEQAVVALRNLRSLLFLPLRVGDEPEGALIVGSTGEPRALSDEDVDLCRTLASLAALAAANARLYQAKQRQAAELEQEVADRRRAEEEREGLQFQLAHAQKLEAVGRLAGGVAHDFNNMLAVILGRGELALRRGSLEGSLRRDLEEIVQAAERSSVLTRQLLAFARRQTVSPQVLDLNAAVAGMLRMLRRLIGEDVDLVWVPGAGLWTVRIDPSQLDQLLANLVVNARDAIAGTGRITLETRNVTLKEAVGTRDEVFPAGQYVLLTVSDDGCGMEEETLSHLFEPFYTTKPPGQGTGLGLATVYGIARQNGGFVDAVSEPGAGSTFRVHLPRAGAETATPPGRAAAAAPPGGSETVLLVEDEESILALGREILGQFGYCVLAAGTPEEALRLAGAHAGDIHLLVTDVVMPGMNGRELAARLTAARPGLRCLFVSGYSADVLARRGVLDEGVRLLEKPFRMRQLAEKVREALEGRTTDG
ncbi:MAG: PAS domain S-box protein [Deltaproteobacteria bacterium]|nr:PAS domain S-box protein [Deltaproteobacteria bacterium]